MSQPICAFCGQPAKGFAQINNDRYCHEDARPDCFQKAQWNKYVAPENRYYPEKS